MGNYEEAEPLLLRAQDILEKNFGTNHPIVATSLDNLADYYEGTKRLVEAKALREKAEQIRFQKS